VSGICGLLNLDGSPVRPGELRDMVSLLERRGPDGSAITTRARVGFGHTLLGTTPEATAEQLPLEHAPTGCLITGDARLDNRAELLARHRVPSSARIGDVELILLAYLEWGEACVEHLLGDFAFAVWDPAAQQLFCARDPMGMRPFYYHHSPGRFFAFASEPRAVLVLPQVPYSLNDARIADFLVLQLEGLDNTSTFFEEVVRLPPAHAAVVTPDGLRTRRYWQLEAGDELHLPTDGDYAEAFLEVFTASVRSRLRGAETVGSMLSGGMDSGSIVAVASSLLLAAGRGPLRTYSAVSADPQGCIETASINRALELDGLAPTTIVSDELAGLRDLQERSWEPEEPFDAWMTLVRAIYLQGHRTGRNAMLDGAGGDTVLGEAERLTHLLRAGRWRRAYREAAAQNDFWGGGFPPFPECSRRLAGVITPERILRLRRRMRHPSLVAHEIAASAIAPDFAREIGLAERLEQHFDQVRPDRTKSEREQRVDAIQHPYLTVARERYDRVASALGVEPRDPFLDGRVLRLAVRLPGEQLLDGGWSKSVLRRAMADRLPEDFRYRKGKEHLGPEFTRAVVASNPTPLWDRLEPHREQIARYVDLDGLATKVSGAHEPGLLYGVVHLATWLQRHRERPQPNTEDSVRRRSRRPGGRQR
jgi:asparagine synthase (glutamine-hydrolysing)